MNSFIHILALLGGVGYLMAATLYLRHFGRPVPRSANRYFAFACVFHFFSLFGMTWMAGGFQGFGLFTSGAALLLAVLFLSLKDAYRLNQLGAFTIPLVLGFFIFSGLVLHYPVQVDKGSGIGPALLAHISFMLIAISVFSLSAVLASGIIFKESQIRNRTWHKLTAKIPSIERLENLGNGFTYLGCASLLAGVGSGFYLSTGRRSIYGSADPLLLASALVLTVYLVILLSSRMTGLRGRKAAWLSMCGYILMVVSLAGANFIENLHVYR